jgi:hypothetical protein
VSITLQLTPWGPFHARKNNEAIRAWLKSIGRDAEEIFRGGMGNYPPPSGPGAWPNNRTGNLSRTIRSIATSDSVEVGTSMRYSIYLRHGTNKMARRKMSDNALEEALHRSRPAVRFAEWVRS